ncbi:SgcJ/EcaC family oxidoreductase [Larkinella terrae]|uniref:SgcJ/EcaC family oxidoreductase n=1 Tax=Larkinella terrae TaxID=2025311 RepID=A0A7K0EH30_9BACT|nr:SgcJ/EcaC family oxidoreductase [Larkinella terrae]MRS60766.1 SgcJ/EcaC family oxidoreductase [Larkinella terrae]
MTNDEKQIRELLETIKEAWGKGDAQLFSSCFTDDCDYVTFAGDHLEGRKANAEAHKALWSGILRGSKLNGRVKKIRFLTPDIALVYGLGAVQLRWQKAAPKGRDSISTNVVIRQNGTWKITAFHNCRIQKPGFFQKLFMKIFS